MNVRWYKIVNGFVRDEQNYKRNAIMYQKPVEI